MSAERRLQESGLILPGPPAAAGEDVPVRHVGSQVHAVGQGPLFAEGGFVTGKVGADLDLEQARAAARLDALAQRGLDSALGALQCAGHRVMRTVCTPAWMAGLRDPRAHPARAGDGQEVDVVRRVCHRSRRNLPNGRPP
jgi:hypothetical protein